MCINACTSVDTPIERSLRPADTSKIVSDSLALRPLQWNDTVAAEKDTIIKQAYVSPASLARIYPVDEAGKDSSFFIFRETLKTAIRERNTAYVHSIIHPEALGSFGGDGGKSEFINLYFNDKHPEDSRFWHILADLIEKGGKFKKDAEGEFFIAPYAAANNLPDSLMDEVCECLVVLQPKVPVHISPEPNAYIIDTLSYDLILSEGDKSSNGWYYVKSRKSGYFKAEVWWPFDYRIFFQKENGKWWIRYLVAGD